MTPKRNVLFVCGRNKRRSRTAHELYRRDRRINARSAGLSPRSPHQLAETDVEWADLIFVMEESHRARLRALYRHLSLPKVVVLHIEDEYAYMDAELVELLHDGIDSYLSDAANET